MENKFKLTREENVFIAKRNIVDYIWKSANLEGIGVTYPETQAIYDGGIVNGLTVDKIIAINNLKYAWQFILENDDIEYDYKVLCHLHKLTADKLVLDRDLGRIRTTPVNIGGTTWKPDFPIESKIKEELEEILNQDNKTKTEIAIEIMLWVMRRQMFIDGNKRVAMLFANKIMIDNGCGIITISQENQPTFYEKLIKFYETNDMNDLKQWIYDTSIDGMNL
ncbi:MAG: Fic family protein [Bacilli bacterium]|nr:Fic family protein [Bacilli bacterium]